ncbi:hypothetical protein GCM10010440_00220 [Kitasatospora cinereorecta]
MEMFGTWNPDLFVPPPQRARHPDPSPQTDHLHVPRGSRKRRRARSTAERRTKLVGELFRTLIALAVTIVCVLGWTLSYAPLQDLAFSRVPPGFSELWPAVVYGPWLAGCLSILRAALDGRRSVHSWVVVLAFSAAATGLCVCDMSRSAPDMIVAGLPPIAAAICLDQLVRQFVAPQQTRRPRARHVARVRRTE